MPTFLQKRSARREERAPLSGGVLFAFIKSLVERSAFSCSLLNALSTSVRFQRYPIKIRK